MVTVLKLNTETTLRLSMSARELLYDANNTLDFKESDDTVSCSDGTTGLLDDVTDDVNSYEQSSFDDSNNVVPVVSDEEFNHSFSLLPVVDTTSTTYEKSASKKVQFSNLSILEFGIDIGDNPTPKSGPSITIQWKNHSIHIVSVDEYEKASTSRRRGRELLIPPAERLAKLLRAGYKHRQIISETRPVNIVRTQRRKTLATLSSFELHEMSEKISRTTKNILSFGLLQRKEKEFLIASGAIKKKTFQAPSA